MWMHNCMSVSLCAAISFGVHVSQAQRTTPFVSATASSAFSSGAFQAEEATEIGPGYWCSAGSHMPGQHVTWTGITSAQQATLGVTINWAYGPGEFKILTSADGGNFEEAVGWHSPDREDISYKEIVMFDAPRSVKALTLVMRSPKKEGYFGINDVTLLVRPGASMLIAGSSSIAGHVCLVANGHALDGKNCLDAIARGFGEEVFIWNSKSQLVAPTGECISFIGGGSRKLGLQDCDEAAEAGDGRSNFVLSLSSHLKTMSDECVSVSASGALVVPCVNSDETMVTVVPVPELDMGPAASVQDAAALLRAADARQRSLLTDLKAQLGKCKGLVQVNSSIASSKGSAAISRSLVSASLNPLQQTAGKIDEAVDVDLAAVKALISESKSIIASVSSAFL